MVSLAVLLLPLLPLLLLLCTFFRDDRGKVGFVLDRRCGDPTRMRVVPTLPPPFFESSLLVARQEEGFLGVTGTRPAGGESSHRLFSDNLLFACLSGVITSATA